MDDEVMVLASERPVIQTALNVPIETIHELQPGDGMMITLWIVKLIISMERSFSRIVSIFTISQMNII